MKKLLKLSNSFHVPNWLCIILALCLILRIPSFFEPYSYGDETTYLTLGESVRQGDILYKDIFDHKPPLLYYVAAIAGNLTWFKAILAFWSFFVIIMFWKLTEVLFPSVNAPPDRALQNSRLQKIATFIFALLTTLPLFEGNIANAENFMIGFSILAFYILLTKTPSALNLIVAGILLAIATLFKVPALFEAPVIVFFWVITSKLSNIGETIRKTILLMIGFAIPIALTFAWYASRGAFMDFFTWGFLINFKYINAFRPEADAQPFLQKNLPLIIRGVLALLGVFILFLARKKLSKQFVFITVWLFMTLFAVALPERPYPHYLLQAVPPFTLLLAMLIALPSFEQILVIIPLSVAFFVPVYYKFWYYSTTAYYQRFIEFAVGKVDKQQYLTNFGGHIPRSYKIAEVVMSISKSKDPVLVWGPESQTVYALSRRVPPIRWVANFHIFDYSTLEQTFKEISANPPKVIVILPDAPDFPELDKYIELEYHSVETVDGAEIFLKTGF